MLPRLIIVLFARMVYRLFREVAMLLLDGVILRIRVILRYWRVLRLGIVHIVLILIII